MSTNNLSSFCKHDVEIEIDSEEVHEWCEKMEIPKKNYVISPGMVSFKQSGDAVAFIFAFK